MKHTHVLSFAFNLQALQAYLLLQQDYSEVSQDRHTSRVGFFPFCVNWPEHVRPRQRLWGSAELLLICTCIQDFSLYVPQGQSACPYRLCWASSSGCSQSLSLHQTNAFISIFIPNSRIQATAPVWKPFMPEVVLKVYVLMESLLRK